MKHQEPRERIRAEAGDKFLGNCQSIFNYMIQKYKRKPQKFTKKSSHVY